MATQDDINNLTDQISEEQQSATILDQQITAEQQRSTQLIEGWQQQSRRHRDAAVRMEQDLHAKQKQLERELQEAKAASDEARRAANKISGGLF